MKILIIQLARLGDILQTWPALRALKRAQPEAQVHLLVREKFKEALWGLRAMDAVWPFATSEVLQPIIDSDLITASELPYKQSLENLGRVIESLRQENFTQIINLSFSPFSSYLTQALARPETNVVGYTRHDDGYLDLPDEVSRYFYAQCGIHRFNRIHLANIFAAACAVELIDQDWKSDDVAIDLPVSNLMVDGPYIVVHLGASHHSKTYPLDLWCLVIRKITRQWQGQIVLIGTGNEIQTAEVVERFSAKNTLINLVGKTRWVELWPLIKKAELLVGCDSGPMQVASLTQTKCVNLSNSAVRFWETGPRTLESLILWSQDFRDLRADIVSEMILDILYAQKISPPTVPAPPVQYFSTVALVPSYEPIKLENKIDSLSTKGFWEWKLIEYLYFDGNYPTLDSIEILDALAQMDSLNSIALQQVRTLSQCPQDPLAANILDRVDELFHLLTVARPEVSPLFQWYQAQKVRMGPAPVCELIAQTEKLHLQLAKWISPFKMAALEAGYDWVKSMYPYSSDPLASDGCPNDFLKSWPEISPGLLFQLEANSQQIAQFFRELKIKEGHREMLGLIEKMNSMLEIFRQVQLGGASGTQQNMNELLKSSIEISKIGGKLAELVATIEKACVDRDYVMVADVLQYDFASWITSISQALPGSSAERY